MKILLTILLETALFAGGWFVVYKSMDYFVNKFRK